jgi:predicted RNA binding protein YcfA (HicA-like mRNA interferase family)
MFLKKWSRSSHEQVAGLSGREIVKRLRHFGFEFDRQVGSHMMLRRHIPPAMTLSVPNHKTVKKGTLAGILRQADISLEEFLQAK